MKAIRDGSTPRFKALYDMHLSYKATGLLLFVFGQYDPEDLTLTFLSNAKPDRRSSVLNTLSELEKAGYLLYLQWRDGQGRWDSDYIFFETPQLKDKYIQSLSCEEKQRISTIKPQKRGVA
jgi:hypothetical protein